MSQHMLKPLEVCEYKFLKKKKKTDKVNSNQAGWNLKIPRTICLYLCTSPNF